MDFLITTSAVPHGEKLHGGKHPSAINVDSASSYFPFFHREEIDRLKSDEFWAQAVHTSILFNQNCSCTYIAANR